MNAIRQVLPAAQQNAAPISQTDEGVDVGQLVTWFEDAEESSVESRKGAERDRDYTDGKQLTQEEEDELAKRGQPNIVINRVQAKVNYLLGYEASQRMDPRGYPRTPQDEDGAEACTDALRYVSEKVRLKQWLSQVWENMIVEGFGGIEVNVKPAANGDAEITVTSWHWDRLFYDPHSRAHDFSDARYVGGVVWMDFEAAVAKWPEGRDALEKTLETDGHSTYDDRPAWKQWTTSGKRKRVRVVQIWYLDKGIWHWSIFTKGGQLQGGPLPFRGENGESLCNMLMQSAFIDRNNHRYGYVRSMIGPQDEINKRRSKALHLLMGKPFVYEDGAVEDPDHVKSELAKANGAVKIDAGFRFDLLDNTQELSGHLGLLQEAKQEIDLMGPNASMQGKGGRSASGRAILANQQGGQVEIYRLFDRFNHLKYRVYRLIWSMVRQYWTAQKWVRVTDDDRNVRFVGFNRPVTLAEDLLAKAQKNGIPAEQAKADIIQQVQQNLLLEQKLKQVVRVENVPAEMDMDIILEEVPDAANVQEEQFQILANLASAGIQFPPKVYIKASGLRDKNELLKLLEEAQADPANGAAAQAQMEKLQAEIEQIRAEVGLTRAKGLKTLAEADAADGFTGQVIDPKVIREGESDQMQPALPAPPIEGPPPGY